MTGTRWIGLGGFRSVDTRHETWQEKPSGVDPRPESATGGGCAATKNQGRIFLTSWTEIIFDQRIQDDRIIYLDSNLTPYSKRAINKIHIEMNAFR